MKKRIYLLSLALSSLVLASCDKDKEKDKAPTPVEAKETLVLTSIASDSTLADIFEGEETPDYFVNEDIFISAKLSISPGVIIAVASDKKITVQPKGTLVANGGPREDMIVFRGKTQQAGFWRGIMVESTTGQNKLDHVEIAHAGSNTLLSGKKAALVLFGVNATNPIKISLLGSYFHDNEGYGLFVQEGAVLQEFSSNGFERNSQAGIITSADQVHKIDAGTNFEANGKTDVEVYTSTIKGSGELVWPATRFQITATSGLQVKGGWKIAPGATLEFANNTQIRVDEGAGNYIHAVGTATNPITFTAINKERGAWKGIVIYSNNDKNSLQHAHVAYGGSSTLNGKRANIYVLYANKIDLRSTKISQSSGYGIYLSKQALINPDFEQANEFEQNNDGMYFREL